MREWHHSLLAGVALPLAACAAAAGGGPGDMTTEASANAACPATRGWVAWVNAMPGPNMVPTLIVEGEVELPAGTRAVLEQGPLDRMLPPAQRFALRIAPVNAGGDHAGGWRKVRAEVAPAQTSYRAVLIGCNGQALAEITGVTRAY